MKITKCKYFAVFAMIGLITLGVANTSHATPVVGFDAGNIIDDVVFTNYTSMNVSQIQTFLNAKVPSCDTNGTQTSEYGGGTRAQWAANASLHPIMGAFYPPFTCLKDYSENGISAAQIIYNVSQQYQINPQVLIVLLQKEQALITDTWPSPYQYQHATGYGCPDTAPCDTQYYGLTRQLYWAATGFHAIATNTSAWSNPYGSGTRWDPTFILGDNTIQFSPNVACGSSTVNIRNRATTALYTYTPYQPNQAALDAGWGTAPCGAYGNRNFYLYFTDWFGSTFAPNFSAQSVWQQVYTDNTKSTPLGWNATLITGQSAYVEIVMKNTGNMKWTKSGAFGVTDTRLATSKSWGRQSAFCNGSWVINCTRPASLKETSVAPGQFGTFEFAIKAPSKTGSYIESFAPIVDGLTVFSKGGMGVGLTVVAPAFSAQSVWQQVYDSNGAALGWNANLLTGQTAHVVIAMKNTGNMTWTNTGAFGAASTNTRLATYSWGRRSSFCDNSWIINCTRPASLIEASVAPGATGTFEFTIKAPNQPGSYIESFSPVIDGRTVFSKGVVSVGLNVSVPNFSAQSVWQQVYTNNSKITSLGWNASLNKSQSAYAVVVMKNTSNFTWTKSGGLYDTRLATYPWGRQSVFCNGSWIINCTRPASLQENSVAPGQYGTFEFAVRAPTQNGMYSESFGLVVDGKSTFKGTPTTYKLTVQ